MKTLLALLLGCCLLCGCSQPTPSGGGTTYTLLSGEITNGVAIVFDAVPDSALVQRLTAVGAEVSDPPTTFVLRTVDTQEKRKAVTAALIAGALVKGLQ